MYDLDPGSVWVRPYSADDLRAAVRGVRASVGAGEAAAFAEFTAKYRCTEGGGVTAAEAAAAADAVAARPPPPPPLAVPEAEEGGACARSPPALCASRTQLPRPQACWRRLDGSSASCLARLVRACGAGVGRRLIAVSQIPFLLYPRLRRRRHGRQDLRREPAWPCRADRGRDRADPVRLLRGPTRWVRCGVACAPPTGGTVECLGNSFGRRENMRRLDFGFNCEIDDKLLPAHTPAKGIQTIGDYSNCTCDGETPRQTHSQNAFPNGVT